MTEIMAYGYPMGTQLSNEYQHDRVLMVLVGLKTFVSLSFAVALEGLTIHVSKFLLKKMELWSYRTFESNFRCKHKL